MYEKFGIIHKLQVF